MDVGDEEEPVGDVAADVIVEHRDGGYRSKDGLYKRYIMRDAIYELQMNILRGEQRDSLVHLRPIPEEDRSG